MAVDNHTFRMADCATEVFGGSLGDSLDALEFFHERARRHITYPFYRIELTAYLPFRTAKPVVGDAEAVGFVAEMLHDLKASALLVDVKGQSVSGELDFLETLGDSDKSHLSPYPHFIECLDCRGQLSFSSVDHHKLRQRFSLGYHT